MKKKEIKQPITKGVAKVPVIMQMEALECGAASLTMVLAYYGKWIPLEQVRADCGVSRDGSNAKNVMKAAQSYGLEVRAKRTEPEILRERGTFPCIIHWNFNHFVVLDGFKNGKAILNDPARGTVPVDMEVFDASFTGICLQFAPGENFEPGGAPKSMVRYAKMRLKDAGGALAFVTLITLISSLIGVVYPAFSRIFLDRLLTHKNPGWFWPFLAALAGISILQLITAWIQAVWSLRITGKLASVGSATFLWKVLHMPMEFFSQRMTGDIQQRQATNASIAQELVNTLGPLVLDAVMMVFYLVVMLRYSWILALVGIASVAVNLWVGRFISKKRTDIMRVQLRDSGKLSSSTLAAVEMIETIKSAGAENGYFERWAGFQASVNAQEMKFARTEANLGLIPVCVSLFTDTLILYLGVLFVMQGHFTVGMVMAFQGFLASFTSPAMNLITAGQTIQEMRTEMERVEDVMEYPEDENMLDAAADGASAAQAAGGTNTAQMVGGTNAAQAAGGANTAQTVGGTNTAQAADEAGFDKLSGAVEMRHVTFGYSRLAEPLIEDFNLKLKPGSRVAFVGGSGCGKSTLSKLISGLYQPWSGEILFDGKTIRQIDRAVFTGSLAVVDQDIILFEDTIAENIKMWDKSIEDFEMVLAARDAGIHDDIMQREGGYRHKLTEGGRDFSGGQRQRMEIARVLAMDPTIIILDEATSALDAKTEYEVVKAIKNRGITCIVVAHRLSTIRDCDEIIVLDRGKVVERGTHEELYAMGGYYTQLVSND